MPELTNSAAVLCVACRVNPPDVTCSCGDKFDFNCIQQHKEDILREFQYVQSRAGEQLIIIEQLVENDYVTNGKTIVENWRRQRLQDINVIADAAIMDMSTKEKASVDIEQYRKQYNLSYELSHITHDYLTSMVVLHQKIQDRLDQVINLSKHPFDEINLDKQLQLQLNPQLLNQNFTEHDRETNFHSSDMKIIPMNDTSPSIPPTPSEKMTTIDFCMTACAKSVSDEFSKTSNADKIINKNQFNAPKEVNLNETTTKELTNDNTEMVTSNSSNNESGSAEEFDRGKTVAIQREPTIHIEVENDNNVGTLCCHKNRLIYNECDQKTRTSHLVLIPDIEQADVKVIHNWPSPNKVINENDDDWIQDIAYSNELQGFLLLNRLRLRFLRDQFNELEEYYRFPERLMKRIACDEKYIYLVSTPSFIGQDGDEVMLLNYNKEEVITKSFRDIILNRNNRLAGPIIGEISDIAINDSRHLILSYRLARRREVGLCIYNISNDGTDWRPVKQLLLNDCWHADLSYTPRLEWCANFDVFILIEFITSHLIMIDETGIVQGECRFDNARNTRESPLNLSVSLSNWLCVRFPSSINIHRLDANPSS